MDERKEMEMTKGIGRPALFVVASLMAMGTFAFAHEPTKKSAGMDDKVCGEHHSAAMKACDQVSMHLAEAKRAGTTAEMRRHVEMAEKSMAEMKEHMSMCMEMMDMHGGKMGAGMMGSGMASAEKKSSAKVVDPVCGMEVDPAKSSKATYGGKTYYFCSDEDKAKFEKNPEQYVPKKS